MLDEEMEMVGREDVVGDEVDDVAVNDGEMSSIGLVGA